MGELFKRPIRNIQNIEWTIVTLTGITFSFLLYLVIVSNTNPHIANTIIKKTFVFIFSLEFSEIPLMIFLKLVIWICGTSLFIGYLYKK